MCFNALEEGMTDRRTTNRALVRFILLPTIFLIVALLGGVRVAAETGALVFVAPPLVTLILAVMLLALFVRGGAVVAGRWLSADNTAAANVSHALTLGALFFAIAAGAAFQVVVEVGRYVARQAPGGLRSGYAIGGFLAGVVAMYVTGILAA